MHIASKGSSFVEALVALALIMISGVSLAVVQRETSFIQQQLLWRWQASQWLDILSTVEESTAQTLPQAPSLWCSETQPSTDCSQQSCELQSLQVWQRQNLCDVMHQELGQVVVMIKSCGSHLCLAMANTENAARRCELGEPTCLMRELNRS